MLRATSTSCPTHAEGHRPAAPIFHTNVKQNCTGPKARPVVRDDVCDRMIGATFCSDFSGHRVGYFEPKRKRGVTGQGVVECVALTTSLGLAEGGTICQ